MSIKTILKTGVQELFNTFFFWKERSNQKFKGDRFEEWVVCNSQIYKSDTPFAYWRLIDWRSDKFVDGYFPQSSKDPDLLLECIYEGEITSYRYGERIAVECKWREKRSFYLDKERIYDYESYLQRSSIDNLFYVFGFGWKEDAPEEVYVIPAGALYECLQNDDDDDYIIRFTTQEEREEILSNFRVRNKRLIYKPFRKE